MKYNMKPLLLLLIIIVSSFSEKSFATDYPFTTASGTFGVLNTSYVGSMSNTYTINTGAGSTILLLYTADIDPSDYLLISSVDANNNIVASKVVADASGTYTTTLANGRALVTFYSGSTGHYADMGYRGFTIQYSTTSSIAQGQIYNYQGNTVLTGKVGIGTYNPGFALDVSGSTNVSNDLFANGKIGIGTQTPATLLNVVGTTDLSPTTHGLMVLGATNTSNIGFDQNEIMARTNGAASTLYLNHEGGNVIFNGTNAASGYVGIGTATPTSILSFGGTSPRTIQMERNTTSSTAGQGLTLSAGGSAVGAYNLAGGDLTLKSGISTGTGSSSIHFLTAKAGTSGSADISPSEKMTILGSGNVGIGTTAPLSKLDIRDGSIYLTDADVVHGMTGYYYENNYGILGPISETAGGLNLYGISDVDAVGLRLNGTIGSATPAASTAAIMFNATKKSGTSVQALGATDMAFRIDNSSTPLMTVFGNGSVGIGTTTAVASSKLDVRGNVYINAGVDSTNINWGGHQLIMGTPPDDYANNTLTLRPGGSTTGPLFSRLALWHAYSKTNKVNTIQLQSSGISFINGGNLGIGTVNPDALLTVNGMIHAKEVKVDLSGPLADYVFDATYKLRSLPEVNTFIKDNGHLPEIPSAAEAEKNGINIADMQVKLLQKIEELTLYAIQQQEKSIDQQKRIEALEKELREVKNK